MKRTSHLHIRINAYERELIADLEKASGLSASDYIRSLIRSKHFELKSGATARVIRKAAR
jgi:hypothetical protein